MKELSIGEKAKRYDEAIKKAKEYHDVDTDNTMTIYARGTMEYLFPELQESKDERIMKALIHFFSNDENTSFEYWEGIPKAEVLAWLKKQGRVKESTISQHENKTCKESNNSLTSEDEMIR